MSPDPRSFFERAALAIRIWVTYVVVRVHAARTPLPACVASLSRGRGRRHQYPVTRLSRAVDRCLRLGSRGPRCLFTALVLFRMLKQQGERVELVIGLPDAAEGPEAHAWVEIDGVDVGPPPGRRAHQPIARYA